MYHVPILLVAHARCAGEQGLVRPQLLWAGADSRGFITPGLMLLSKQATLSAIRKPGDLELGAEEHVPFVPERGEAAFRKALPQLWCRCQGHSPVPRWH